MSKLIGNKPGQVPVNADLGDLAYQDGDNATIGPLTVVDGRVGIGTNSPSDKLVVSDGGSAFSALQIESGTSGISELRFADTADANVGFISYIHNGDYMRIATNASEAMRIESSGNVDILSGVLELNGNKLNGIQVTIADDAFATITPTGRFGGHVSVVSESQSFFPQQIQSYLGFIDFGNSVDVTDIRKGADFETSTSGPPDGTTGTDDKITLFAGGTSGYFYIENRSGGQRTFQVTLL